MKEVTQIADGEVDCHSHLRRHHHERHVPAQRSNNEQQCTAGLVEELANQSPHKNGNEHIQATYLLQMSCHNIIPTGNLPIRTSQHPSGRRDTTEDAGKHEVNTAGEDEEGEESEAPDDEVESKGSVVLDASHALGHVAGWRVGGSEAEGG